VYILLNGKWYCIVAYTEYLCETLFFYASLMFLTSWLLYPVAISLTKQQFVITHRYTNSTQFYRTQKIDQYFSMSCFY